uniref:subtilisin-like protease n=1 Tax=Erigeron canadensis TaxID=72917 RepID=UPI001CB9A98C|nr:subtilisin-like protease [Erigeron canadensis]
MKTYIVHLSSPEDQVIPQQSHDLEEWYYSFLSNITYTNSITEKPKIVYAYHHVITGFSAKMSAEQAEAMTNMIGVAEVRPESLFQLHTTHSQQFLGLHHYSTGLWKGSNYGKGTIIGILDSGITPGHVSFHDKGVPPPPARWKGKCEIAGCNNKLIGMRNFVLTERSPVDEQGHGTHTSSTAAGNFVANANIFGYANGTASGTAPHAHLAMYRVCDQQYCSESNLLAGMDAAITDGVDVLSISLGGRSAPFYRDALAICAFAAIQKGIFVSCSAGNSGPFMSSLSNESPWVLTVGASTMDRKIRTTVYLGNKKLIDGESLYQPKNFIQKLMPLVYPGKKGDYNAATCRRGSLNGIDVKGKVVLCDLGGMIEAIEKGEVVKDAGGAAMILANAGSCPETTEPQVHVLPASNVGYKEGVKIKRYLSSTSSPIAAILFRGTVIGIKSAPQVACFSSRGPSLASPGILKPDIIGPGVDVLAAWPNVVNYRPHIKTTFNLLSGTSMACPHLAGIAALLKSTHPKWSPAAIKSAIMTTASQVSLNNKFIADERKLPADIYDIGAGHVSPSKANNPGIVFDIQPHDYIAYMCGLGYTNEQIRMIVKRHFYCIKSIPEAELNYPSFVVALKSGDRKAYSRTVTNVGIARSTYTIGNVSLPQGVHMVISRPQGLRFIAMNQKLTYKLTFSRDYTDKIRGPYGQGYMTWISGKYSVRTPFLFMFR